MKSGSLLVLLMAVALVPRKSLGHVKYSVNMLSKKEKEHPESYIPQGDLNTNGDGKRPVSLTGGRLAAPRAGEWKGC